MPAKKSTKPKGPPKDFAALAARNKDKPQGEVYELAMAKADEVMVRALARVTDLRKEEARLANELKDVKKKLEKQSPDVDQIKSTWLDSNPVLIGLWETQSHQDELVEQAKERAEEAKAKAAAKAEAQAAKPK